MKRSVILTAGMSILFTAFLAPTVSAQSINVDNLKTIRLRTYLAGGLVWKGESTQNTNWNKICESPDGRIWYAGGDHWGTDRTGEKYADRYDRPWGFGNTAVSWYDPKTDTYGVEFELDRASSLFSNSETPGHGKIHANIQSDSKGRIYTVGYLGSSYGHEYTQQFYPSSYAGGAVIRYDPATKDVEYYGIPCRHGASVALYYDESRNAVNGITVDRAKFWRIDLDTRESEVYESLARMSRVNDRVREMIMDAEGFCYFANDIGGLTRFDPDTKAFTDLPIQLPGDKMDFRASVVSSDNVIYGITTGGFVWSYDVKHAELKEFGHVLGMPGQPHYTPNIALDEQWGRLYFLAGNHGGPVLEDALEVLTILDLKSGAYYWVGKVEDIEGCFGAVGASDHTVYFSCFGKNRKDDGSVEKDEKGRSITRPFLVRYDPPENLADLKLTTR